MRSLALLVLALLVILSSFQKRALAQSSSKAATSSQAETSWERVGACPFDSSRALLPVVCGRLKVPENYDDPKSRSIEIAFMVVKARKNIDPEHPVLFLNGGPGQTSLYFAETLVTNPLIHDVVVDRDWVFFDQRGTGRSIPQFNTLYASANGSKAINDAIDAHIDRNVELPEGPSVYLFCDPEECNRQLRRAGFTKSFQFDMVTVLWKVPSVQFVFDAEKEAGVRTAALLREQTADTLAATRENMERNLEQFKTPDGLSLPMAAHVISAQK